MSEKAQNLNHLQQRINSMKELNVLSLFNGMSGGLMALKELNINVGNYYSSDIDKFANKATKEMFPEVIQLGDIRNHKKWDIDLSSIDLLLAGFPCQAWSMAGKMKGDNDPRGALVHDLIDIFTRIKNTNPDVKFLFENVNMKKEFLDYINDLFGIKPIKINSSLVSAQNRVRLYWTNIDNVSQPKDKGITWGDIREHGVNSFYYTERGLQWIARHSRRKNKTLDVWGDNDKGQMCEASDYKSYSSQRFYGICDFPTDKECIAAMRGRYLLNGKRNDKLQSTKGNTTQYIEFRHDGKSNCLTTVDKDNVIVPFTLPNRIPVNMFFFRYKTVRESARLQTIPEYHIDTLLNSGISKTQLLKMIGNGWTHNVITHIFKNLN